MAELPGPERGAEHLLALYDRALPSVYGYLISRCRRVALAEELAAETFLAATSAIQANPAEPLSTAWLLGVARHKLVDHWRRRAREERGLRELSTGPQDEDPWDAALDVIRARETLDLLGAHHRAALTLRYVDDLTVPEVADLLDRTVHATEALLVRARAAFRRAYTALETPDA